MRGLVVVAILLALVPRPGAAQLQEQDVQVPTSRETREAAEQEVEAAEREAAEQEAAEQEAAETPARDWRELAAPGDVERIEANERAYGRALELARRAGSDADRAELGRILADLPQPIDAAALPGRWDCRTIRFVEEPADFRVYGWFPCQISELPQGLLLEKLGGSELTAGYLYPESETRMIYLGYAHGQTEPAREYPGADGPAERLDPGILTQRGPDRLLLAKPDPAGDADYDFLDFRRR